MAICNFVRHRGGNVAIMFGLVAFPLVFLVGAGIDYAVAARMQSKLNAAADAAALAAVTPKMMGKTSDDAKAAAKKMFMGQTPSIQGLTFDSSDPQVDISTSPSGARIATVTYTAYVPNAFSKIYHRDTTKIGGGSSASAETAANIDFYLLLDTSPSMAIAATEDGIKKMVYLTKDKKTKNNANCAFACHQESPDAENPGSVDNYQLAKDNNIPLRIGNVKTAVKDLMATAKIKVSSNNAKYRVAIYTFDVAFKEISNLTSNLDAVGTAASNIQLLTVYSQNCLTWEDCNYDPKADRKPGQEDTDTDYRSAMSNIGFIMPKSGNGTNDPKDTPQEVLFLVTDGVGDTVKSGKRVISKMDNESCKTIKDRGIRIAVLYTTYFPLPTNDFYMDNVDSFQSKIGPNMQNCASPGLYFEVTTNGDISAAMTKLFENAVATAPHLTR